jgi:hypothetical protein
MSKYEHNPTNSQKMYNCKRLFDITIPSIENEKSEIKAKKREKPSSPCI